MMNQVTRQYELQRRKVTVNFGSMHITFEVGPLSGILPLATQSTAVEASTWASLGCLKQNTTLMWILVRLLFARNLPRMQGVNDEK
jgi:hypothetical protein